MRKKNSLKAKKIVSATMALSLMSSPFFSVPVGAETNTTVPVNVLAEAPSVSPSSVLLRIMETTDIHTNLVDYDYYKGATAPKLGLAKTATLIKQARTEVKNSVLVDNGDLIQGTPLGTYMAKIKTPALAEGEVHPVIKAMNILDYDIAGLGNHEFNYGLEYLDEVYDDATFEMTNANVFVDDKDNDPSNDKNQFAPYVIETKEVTDESGNKHTIKVGYINFVPPQISEWDKAHLEGKVIAKDIVETAKKLVPEMRAQGADLVIALTHSGFNGDVANKEDVIYSLTKEVSGIDAITFSHTHKVFPAATNSALDILFKDANGNPLPGVDNVKGKINGVPAVQAGFGGGFLGIIDLTLEQENGQWVVKDSQSVARSVEKVAPDQEILDAVKAEHEATVNYVNTPIGQTTDNIHSFFALVKDDPSVQVVTNAQKWFVESYIAKNKPEYKDLPILSVGAPFKAGRNSADEYTEIKKGGLSIRSAGDLYLYDNTLKAVKVKGSVVKEWIEMSAGKFNQIDPAKTETQELLNPSFPVYNFDVIDGVNYQIDVTKPRRYDDKGVLLNADSHRVINLTYQGKPVDSNQDFIVVTNNYRAGGGGNFPGVKGSEMVVDSADENRQILMNYISEVKTIVPTADENWSIAPIAGKPKVTFTSSPVGEKYIEQGSGISYTGDLDAKGFGIYNIDLSEKVKVQLLGINDFHGQIDVSKKVSGKDAGTAPVLAAHLKKREATNPNTLMVQAGDMVGASAPASALLQDEPTISILNSIGFDVGTVGNHEFDEGVAEMKRLIYGGKHPKTGNLHFEGSDMKYVVANLKDKNGELLFAPYTIKEVGGVKVGFIGVVLDDTPSVVIPSAVKDVVFTDETEAINKYAAELKSKGVESIVVLAHNPGVSKTDGTGAEGELVTIANGIDDEVDVIFGGHNHAYMNTVVDGKLLVQAYSSGTSFADVDLEISKATGDIIKKKAEIVTTFKNEVTEDAAVKAIVDDAVKKVAPILSEKIGTTKAPILKAENEHGESALGNLIADAMKWKMGTDFAAMNSGGIRADITDAGDITWGELFNIQPFGNDLVKLSLTGAQLRQLLNDQFAKPAAADQRTKFVYISGFKYTWNPQQPHGSKIIDIMLPDGKKLDESKTYTITVNNFMADGGDGYSSLKASAASKVVGSTDLEGLIDFVKDKGEVSGALEGRSLKTTATAPADPQPETPTPADPQPETPKPEDPKPEKPEPNKPEPNKPEPSKPTPQVYWKGSLLKANQIGGLTIEKPINLWKRENGKLVFVRVLKPGEMYRVYGYDQAFGGQYSVGGGFYVTKLKEHVKYETPSKAKLKELRGE